MYRFSVLKTYVRLSRYYFLFCFCRAKNGPLYVPYRPIFHRLCAERYLVELVPPQKNKAVVSAPFKQQLQCRIHRQVIFICAHLSLYLISLNKLITNVIGAQRQASIVSILNKNIFSNLERTIPDYWSGVVKTLNYLSR